MADARHGAAQADAHRRLDAIELPVVGPGQHAVLCGRAWQRVGNERSHEETGDRCVAVGKVEVVRRLRRRIAPGGEAHAAVRDRIQIHPVETGIVIGPALERADGIDADAVKTVRARLIERNHGGIHFHVLQQEILVAHPRQPVLLVDRREAGHVVDARGLEPGDVFPRFRRQRGVRQKLFPSHRRRAAASAATAPAAPGCSNHEAIGAEGLFVEEGGVLQPLEDRAVRILVGFSRQRRRIDADGLHQAERFLAVGERRGDAGRPAVRYPQSPARTKLVALRVAAEVVVVVEDQDAGVRIRARPIEVCGRQPADAAADNHEIVRFARIDRAAGPRPERSVAQRVRHVERSVVAAAHAGQRRRVVAGSVLGELSGGLRIESAQPRTRHQTSHANRHAVQEVPPRDRAVHAKFAVTDRIALIIVCHKSPRTLVCHTLS